jgi:hypothetical protein
MEPLQHSHYQPRKKNSAKVNVTISLVIHGLIFAAGAYWAAHEGVLGKKLRELSVGLIAKEKKPDEQKKAETKTDGPKKVETVKTIEPTKTAAAPTTKFVPPPAAAQAASAPPPVVIGDFTFDKDSISTTDPIVFYKQQVETALRSRWNRPEGVADLDFVAEVEMRVDAQGKIMGYDWKKGSGNQPWDDSVKKALVGAINRPPPNGFPDKFVVRFDVQPTTEPLVSRAD